LNVLWDGTQISTVDSDASGAIPVTSIVIPDNATGASHSICVEFTQGVNVCAAFNLQPPISPSPGPSPSPSPSAGPTPAHTPTVSRTDGSGVSPLALLLQPPFVFLPILAILGLLGFLALWAWRSRPAPPLGEVTINHLAPAPRQWEPGLNAQPSPPPAPEPPAAPIVYESPGASPGPAPAPPPPPPSGADVPPDLPEASD
jgi:hypothetical protein